ncbi:MAG TPA: pyrroloquinoline quinone biosynthesis peptide chaperone PqqD [Bryobacteraceae bacterium]|jgi:coenzyme PQQ biosynthesis protein PqqD|nr:pyrroloquinoline quinone biosynthesis peptide chaperone PqqD [Bryobacteraceae bacterium]
MDILVRQADVEAHQLPDHSVLLFAQSGGTALPVNESGGKIWALCDGTRNVDQIVDELESFYDAPRIQIDRDAREFLATLVSHGLLNPRSGSQ